MIEFVKSAAPWICIGVVIALLASSRRSGEQDDGNKRDNYMSEGMAIGLCFGAALGSENLIYGLMAGMAIGLCIKKPPKDGEKEKK